MDKPTRRKIIVFAKAPVPGQVKSRLRGALDDTEAAQLHCELVMKTLLTATSYPDAACELWCSPDTHHPFFAACAEHFNITLQAQCGDDLGERMQHAFATTLANSDQVVLVGSDCPALTVGYYARAMDALENHHAVFVPTEDGGYSLIALTQTNPALFNGIPWGQPTVMPATEGRLHRMGWRYTLLEKLWDVDRPADLARYRHQLT